MNGNEQFLGLVKDGKLAILLPESEAGAVVRLTEMPMQDSAEVIDLAGPILNALVQKVFGK